MNFFLALWHILFGDDDDLPPPPPANRGDEQWPGRILFPSTFVPSY